MTPKAVLALTERDLCLVAAALGYLHGTVAKDSEEDALDLIESLEMQEFFENKNELMAALMDINKRCAAQVEEQT